MSQISNTNTKSLNQIQSLVYKILKNEGFKKFGRTFTKNVDEGIIHVINFQIGQRNLEGHFTVNLGVYIKELDETKSNSKKIFYDYDCHIRVRLCELSNDLSDWIKLDKNADDISELIIQFLMSDGISWFNLFNSKKSIIINLQRNKIGYFKNSNRAKLDAAILLLNYDKPNAIKLFNKYYNSIDKNNVAHKIYVSSLAHKFDLNFDDTSLNESIDLINKLLNK